MASSERPFWSSLPGKILMTVVVIGGLAALMIPTGREKPDDPIDDPENPTPPPQVVNNCTRDLERIFNGMSPGRLGISSGSEDLAVELNRWFTKCGQDIEEDLTQDVDIQKQLLSEEVFNQLQEERFLPADVEHVRMSLLAWRIADHQCSELPQTSQKVAALFEFVTNQVVLIDSTNSVIADLPKTPYETLVWGMGTAKDRAWVFATLLRQLRIDAFLVIPQSKPAHWLIGVNVPKVGVQLFDPRLGLPVPASSRADRKLSVQPATLSEVRQDGSLLEQFNIANFEYPLNADDLKNVEVALIGTQSLWSNRIARLQYMVSPLDPVELYDGLGPNALRPDGSQRQRIIDAAVKKNLWTEAQVKVWEYPLEQLPAYMAAKADSNSPLTLFEAIYAGPQLVKVDQLTGRVVLDQQTNAPVFAAAKTTLHAVRIEQLSGKHQDALPHFGPILTSYKLNPSPFNEEAATFAAYWIGISQLGTKRFQAAKNSFERFAATQRQSRTQLVPIELMQLAALNWKASIQVQQGDGEDAIQSLQAAQAISASQRNAYLIDRWKHAANDENGSDSR